MNILAAMTGFQWSLCSGFILVCLLLIMVVLLQRGRGGGLGAACGGGGGSSSAFGAKTGDVFTLITVVLAAVYLMIAVLGNHLFVPPGGSVVQAAARTGQPSPTQQTTPIKIPAGATSNRPILPAPAADGPDARAGDTGTSTPAPNDGTGTPDGAAPNGP